MYQTVLLGIVMVILKANSRNNKFVGKIKCEWIAIWNR
jgi:hypothetical protein